MKKYLLLFLLPNLVPGSDFEEGGWNQKHLRHEEFPYG